MRQVLFFLIFLLLFNVSITLSADPLTIRNDSLREIINILIQEKSGTETVEHFIRLDLEPGGTAKVENPGNIIDIRVDTGLELVSFADVPLQGAKTLTLSGASCQDLQISCDKGVVHNAQGTIKSLVPARGEEIVCELSKFRPKMPMSEVCRIIPAKTPQDDNGSLLTGLGFAGLLWAGRLAPAAGTGRLEDLQLEHMELRRSFLRSDIETLLDFLYKQGYVPWQAELPNSELDFANMPDKNPSDRRQALNEVLARYLDNLTHEKGSAVLMLAPAEIMDELATADAPEKDVQLFTLNIRPQSNLLLLDVAAYEGNKQ